MNHQLSARKFEIASGSIVGRKHRHIYQNNQDGYDYIRNELVTIAVVCDGCSSGKHSEVGAKLGAKLVVKVIADQLKEESQTEIVSKITPEFWQKISEKVVKQLRQITETLTIDQSLTQIVNDYFLFTIVGVVITPLETVIFSVGDGVIALNDEIKIVGEEYQNKPPYLAYNLCNYSEEVELEIHYQIPTEQVSSLLIGTDGVKDLITSENKPIPGKSETVQNLSQFWLQDRYFNNPDMIRRYLYLLNQDISKADWKQQQINKQVGLLPDDTTLIVIRSN
jgi:hypothetical protein